MSEFTGKQKEQYRVVVTLERQRVVEHETEGWVPMPGDKPEVRGIVISAPLEENVAVERYNAVVEKLREGGTHAYTQGA